jgi:SPX domain protein involved in polyphosphate accumulation
LKYLLTEEQHHQFVEVLGDYVVADSQGDDLGRYKITSVYYDTTDYKAYWDKIEGHKFRRKVRVRVYGDEPVAENTLCFAEIKQRINKTLQKKRVQIPYASAIALCGAGKSVEMDTELEQATIEEIQYLYYTLQLQPACVVSYDRQAFNGSQYDPGLRVTFDVNLKGRTHDLSLLSLGNVDSKFFIPPDYCILEVKVNYRVPLWLTDMIAEHRCTLRRVSKYCAALEQSKELLQTQKFFV